MLRKNWKKKKKQKMSSIIKLNIGGKRFMTTMSTLRGEQVPKTLSRCENMLTALVENELKGVVSTAKDDDGYLFIDRSGQVFEYVLRFLQTGRVSAAPQIGISRMDVWAELGYFQLVSAPHNRSVEDECFSPPSRPPRISETMSSSSSLTSSSKSSNGKKSKKSKSHATSSSSSSSSASSATTSTSSDLSLDALSSGSAAVSASSSLLSVAASKLLFDGDAHDAHADSDLADGGGASSSSAMMASPDRTRSPPAAVSGNEARSPPVLSPRLVSPSSPPQFMAGRSSSADIDGELVAAAAAAAAKPVVEQAMHAAELSQQFGNVMQSVHDRLRMWRDKAQLFFDLNAVALARRIDQAAAYGSSSVQVLSWSRCRDSATAREFCHTDTGTDFQNLKAVPCALFLQHLAYIIEQELGFRTRTWTQPYNSKSCRITCHFPVYGRNTFSDRQDEALDAFLDLLRSGDYGRRLAVKQEYE
jgi:BTB/POZ domain